MERTEAAIAALEAQNKGSNAEPPSPMPPELRRAHSLQERVRAAQERLASQEQPTKVNLTDGDARFMKGQQGIIPGYNPQAMAAPSPRITRRTKKPLIWVSQNLDLGPTTCELSLF